MYEAIIEHYEAGPEKLKGAISGLSREDMLWKPTDPALGRWSIQQIVLHLLDADLIWCARMNRSSPRKTRPSWATTNQNSPSVFCPRHRTPATPCAFSSSIGVSSRRCCESSPSQPS